MPELLGDEFQVACNEPRDATRKERWHNRNQLHVNRSLLTK